MHFSMHEMDPEATMQKKILTKLKIPKMILLIKEIIIKLICTAYKLTIPIKVRRLHKIEKIKVLFIVNDISKWKSEELYIQMLKKNRFEPMIGLTTRPNNNIHIVELTKKETIEYLEYRKYSYFELSKTVYPYPDIVIYTEPYWKAVPKNQTVLRYLSSLFISINYGFHAIQLDFLYHSMVNEFAWIDCYESQLAINTAYRHIGQRKSIKLTGLPFSDALMKPATRNPWKPQDKNKKRIIWAPHHSLGGFNDESIIYSNFLNICEEMFLIAEGYHDYIQIAFKPHPLLRGKLEALWGTQKTDNYYERWNQLDNGQLSEGSYLDLFKHSDALIHDCSSFMIEYQYMDKPILFITQNTEYILKDLNDFARKAFYMQEFASDIHEIKKFIANVINGVDMKKQERSKFYLEELLPPNNRSACENIIKAITN